MDTPITRSAATAAWGKIDEESRERHHLVHHSADVAAVFFCLLEHPLIERASGRAAGALLDPAARSALAALAFLHDIGKLGPGFQARGWEPGRWPHQTCNHIASAFAWLGTVGDRADTALDGVLPDMLSWVDSHKDLTEWFRIAFSHHGRPVRAVDVGRCDEAFRPAEGYDWMAAEQQMGQALRRWFAPALEGGARLPDTDSFRHFFAGLLALADWVGSDRRAFPFAASFDPDYWEVALNRARRRLGEIGLCPPDRQPRGTGFDAILPGARPSPIQSAVGKAPADARLLILEAETGSGKTEAALWRYLALRAAGVVDALYFALPTRAAASQIFGRVQTALNTMFADPPEAVLAIPGMIAAGSATGQRLPNWSVRWDDDTGADHPARWAAEHATRYLAAEVAVGTVDQAMLAALRVKHVHLRGAALARSLLVIDEVHASDSYMRHVQTALLRQHLALGGHAMLMSATLGAAARAEWLGQALPPLKKAVSTPYPALWSSGRSEPAAPGGSGRSKRVQIASIGGWDGAIAAERAIAAAEQGARVLVIRNTVARAVETWQAVRERAPDLLLQVAGGPALHHSRFAAEDRRLLDRAVEGSLGKSAERDRGMIVIGTQTLEQSLDIDADFLITDLCPMDVLLQRIGRLHRHDRQRPDGFAQPQAAVLTPEAGHEPLLNRAENGLGAYSGDGSLSGVYVDVPGLAATLAQIEAHPEWAIPDRNRALVEAATHPEALDALAAARGQDWQAYRRRVTGKALAEQGVAGLVILDRNAPFPDRFPDDEKIKTRIGEDGVVLRIGGEPISPFGQKISRIALPAHWSRGLAGDEEMTAEEAEDGLILRVADRTFHYGRAGLERS
ncbi:CRISPR-associated helicase Cas3' [Paracoccus sp. (in: a-proteobacteria)]|nr:CRISPR-associated helicase Cas3' [Paracoccus sp. (in: a-proteobacteria)]